MKYILLFLISMPVIAHDFHYDKEHETTNITNISNYDSKGVALAIAKAQHSFDWSTKKWQGSVGMGSFSGQDAISFGAAKRFDRLLINISVGRESNEYGYGAGLNWNF